MQYAYGKFLAFLSAHDDSLLTRTPAERLNRKIIEKYVMSQPSSCGGVTLANYLNHLQLALRYIVQTTIGPGCCRSLDESPLKQNET